ncbi:hypothetical protein V7114_21285 [Neobacillus niacini]
MNKTKGYFPLVTALEEKKAEESVPQLLAVLISFTKTMHFSYS